MTKWKPRRHATHPLPCHRPVMLRAPQSCCAPPSHAGRPPCHAARSRSIQKITAEGCNPGVAGFSRLTRGMTQWKTRRHDRAGLKAAKIFSPATPATPRLPAGLSVKGARLKNQGFRSWTSRKPRLSKRFDGELQKRPAERRSCGLLTQEPPRTTARRVPSQFVVQALPSLGAPS